MNAKNKRPGIEVSYNIAIFSIIIGSFFPFYFSRIQEDFFPYYIKLIPTYGFMSHIYGGWISIVFYLISFFYLNKLKFYRAQLFGFLGCFFLGFNLILYIFISLFQNIELTYGFYVSFICWISCIIINVYLFFYKKDFEKRENLKKNSKG